MTFLLLLGCTPTRQRPAIAPPAKKQAASAVRVVKVPGTREHIYYYKGSGPLEAYASGDRGPYLIEVRGRMTDTEIDALRATGVRFDATEMFTEKTFVARLGPEQRERVASLPFVWEVRLLQPDDKLEPSRLGAGQGGHLEVTIDLLDPDAAKLAAIGELLQSLGAEVLELHGDTVRARVGLAHLDEITRISDVIWIEPSKSRRSTELEE